MATHAEVPAKHLVDQSIAAAASSLIPTLVNRRCTLVCLSQRARGHIVMHMMTPLVLSPAPQPIMKLHSVPAVGKASPTPPAPVFGLQM